MHHFIYKTTCLITNKYYIGIHSTNNINDGYLGSGKLIKYSIFKYGKENHKIEILENFDTREMLSIREFEIVNSKLLNDPLCLNLKIGGENNGWLGGKHSIESKQKIGVKHKGKILTEETKNKISKATKGKKVISQEQKLKLSKPHTEQAKLKMSISRKGKKHSENHKNNMSLSAHKKPLFVSGILYESLSLASKITGFSISKIRGRIESKSEKFKDTYYVIK